MNISEYLACMSYQYDGEWTAISKAVAAKEKVSSFTIREKYITIADETYPACLKALRYPPWVLFYQGDLSLLAKPKASIVGSRMITGYGYDMTRMVSDILMKRFVLVSGLAKGVDACVHQTALHNGYTIGVIGSGLGTQYPRENIRLYEQMRRGHLILSEYPYDVPVQKHHFPWRNRILAALGEFIVVTQAAQRSGTLLTVNEAVSLGKTVYCIPYPFNDSNGIGCNKLIQDGATILYTKEQLLELLPGTHNKVS